MTRTSRRICSLLVLAVLFAAVASGLLLWTFAQLGHDLYRYRRTPPWWELALPLAGALIADGVASAAGGRAGATLTSGLRLGRWTRKILPFWVILT